MILSLRVEETRPTTEEAQKAVDEKVAKVKEILKNYSINISDIKTTNVNTYESFDWRDS
ncbi:SIMPL domain-containing protein [bacterium]|nr:SIMPL domain-containing protein [bacterium]